MIRRHWQVQALAFRRWRMTLRCRCALVVQSEARRLTLACLRPTVLRHLRWRVLLVLEVPVSCLCRLRSRTDSESRWTSACCSHRWKSWVRDCGRLLRSAIVPLPGWPIWSRCWVDTSKSSEVSTDRCCLWSRVAFCFIRSIKQSRNFFRGGLSNAEYCKVH